MRSIPIRNIMISRLESMITASPTIITAGEKITTIGNTADAATMMTRNSALPVWRTNIRTVHLWKAPLSVIPRALDSWKSRGRDNDVFISEDCTGTAMHQDKVRVIITKRAAGRQTPRGNCSKSSGKRYDPDRGNLREQP